MKRKIAITIVLLTMMMHGIASHIIGGSIHYTELSNDQYQVELTLYRDCSSNTEFDDPVSIGCFNASGALVHNLEIDLADAVVTDVPTESYSACYVAPLGLCVEEAIYTGTVTLPAIPGGYTLTYQRCCRNFSIINVPTGTDVGITLTTDIPGSTAVATNSNPAFATHPPLIICLNAPFTFNDAATDADGDELMYELCAPLNTNVDGAYINPPGSPPYNGLAYNAGYSSGYPIDASPAFAINSSTGIITGTPTSLGQYVIGICISEYRDGVLINTTNRDFQLNVTNCAATDSPAIASQENICSGLTVAFNNESVEDLTYHWDFGVEGMETDTSDVYAPTYTYQVPGTYDIMLVLNPGLPCADTTYSTYVSSPTLDPVIATVEYACSNNELLYSFQGTGGTGEGTSFLWTFSGDNISFTSTSQNPEIHLSSPGDIVDVTLELEESGCSESVSTQVQIPLDVLSSIEPQSTFCDGYSYAFTNLSENAESYEWDFDIAGNAGLSTEINPAFTFPDTGLYNVRLIAMNGNLCPDTSSTTMLIYGLLDPYFADHEPECYESNTFSFVAEGASTDEAIYSWNFGGAGLPATSSSATPMNVHFSEAGIYDVSLTITENDCVETYSAEVEVVADPVFSASVDTLKACESGNAFFHGTSEFAHEVYYEWDFGDGNTSSGISPSHQYTSPGIYDVSVTMSTSVGCVSTETRNFYNVINIVAPPVAGFIVGDGMMDLLSAETEITSTAEDAVSCQYYISDGGSSDDCDFSYTFTQSGTITIQQIVTSEEGCTATVTGTVIINGFVFYAPNTFTPNDDGLNDVWIPAVTGARTYQLRIYDRWGDAIFETVDVEQPWTGDVHDGEYFAGDGVYNYVAVAKDLEGLPHEFSGHIVLVR